MADTTRTNPPNRGRGNRGRRGGSSSSGGGGGAETTSSPSTTNTASRPNRGNRGQHRGRGGRGGGRRGVGTHTGGDEHDGGGGEPPGHHPQSIGTSGDRLTGDAKRTQGERAGGASAEGGDKDAEGEDDGDVCFICATKVDHTSIAPCSHRTCHICSLRLRALYKTKACAHCRAESNFVVFTDDSEKRFEDFATTDFPRVDDNLGIKYDTFDIFEDTVLLLRYNCPDPNCEVACLGWPDLHRHVRSKHGKVMCDLCTRNKKVFTHEHELFSPAELRRHEKHGDDLPGAIDQSGFKGHPECGFCRQRFYGDDELYAHCRDKHERCHICDRTSGGRNQQYYVNYDSLESHFNKDHYLCIDKECLEKKFVVFESQMDLKAHQLECHPGGLSKDARRDARLVDISDFDYRSPYQPQRNRREGREGRGAGRGRDPNLEPIPQSSAQPLRRDELAYQRQMAIQSAQSVSTRTFGGQLTSSAPQPTRTPASSTAPSQPSRPAAAPSTPSLPAIETLDIGTPSDQSTPQGQARTIAHSAVIERASSLLRNDERKLRDFRTKVSAYRTSTITASGLIEAFFSLFDTSSAELGKLIKELAHIYEDESKRTSLLEAWNDWRAINEDYPALPGPGGASPFSSSNVSGAGVGKRVLRLKSSTAQSSRSAMRQNATLPGILGSGSSSNPFPPLSSNKGGSKAKNKLAWGTSPAPSPGSSSPVPSRSNSRTPAPAPRSAAGAARDPNSFPALPAAPKPNTLMAGLTRGTVRWDDRRGAPRPAAWSQSDDPTPSESNFNAGDSGQGKKGKGKKGKQVLYQFG